MTISNGSGGSNPSFNYNAGQQSCSLTDITAIQVNTAGASDTVTNNQSGENPVPVTIYGGQGTDVTTNLAINAFTVDDTGDLSVTYTITGPSNQTVAPFTIGIYGSPGASSFTPTELLQTYPVTDPSLLADGTYTVTFAAGFGQLDTNCFLVADLDVYNQVRETSKADNVSAAPLSGVFQADDGNVYAFTARGASGAHNTVLVSQDPTTGNVTVGDNGVDYTFASVSGVTIATPTGDNTINGQVNGQAVAVPLTIYGGAGSDTITGGDGGDTIYGGAAGGNTITGGTGATRSTAAPAAATPFMAAAAARCPAATPTRTARRSTAAPGGGDTITGQGSSDTIYGQGTAGNTITADNGNETVYAGDGGDTITLGNGNNQVFGGTGYDHITVGNGNNWVQAGSGGSYIQAGGGTDWLYGGAGNDTIIGGAGLDYIQGGGGQNTIYSNGYNDVLDNGLTSDMIYPANWRKASLPGSPATRSATPRTRRCRSSPPSATRARFTAATVISRLPAPNASLMRTVRWPVIPAVASGWRARCRWPFTSIGTTLRGAVGRLDAARLVLDLGVQRDRRQRRFAGHDAGGPERTMRYVG